MAVQRSAGVAAQAGFITGFFVGILSLPLITLSVSLGVFRRAFGGSGLFFFFLLAALIAFAIAGYVATRRSGLLRSGVGAGALASAIATFIAVSLGIVIITLLVARLAPAAALSGRIGSGALRAGLRMIIVRSIIGSALLLVAGPLSGMIGGALGRAGAPTQPFAPGPSAPPSYRTPVYTSPVPTAPGYSGSTAPITPISPLPPNPTSGDN